MKVITCRPIGIIHSPFKRTTGMPIQPVGAKGVKGTIEVFPRYAPGLTDLYGFSHIILLYRFHLSRGYSLMTKPFMDNETHGVFATRTPHRPNHIGISVLHLLNIKDNLLQVEEIDIADGTPLLDIKPYVPEFDIRPVKSIGWLAGKTKDAYRWRSV